MTMSESGTYTIELRNRMETVVYRESGLVYGFDVGWANGVHVLYDDIYYDLNQDFAKKPLTDEERSRIVPRLHDFLRIADGYVYLNFQYYKDPLTGKYEKISK